MNFELDGEKEQCFFERNIVIAPSDRPELYGLPLSNEGFVATGADSIVFRVGEKAIKLYAVPDIRKDARWGKMSSEKIRRYVDATMIACARCEELKLTLVVGNRKYEVRVNPIDKVYYSHKLGCLVTESPFIDGECLDQSARAALAKLSLEIERLTGYTGLLVTPDNARLAMVMDGEVKLVVTDLCSNIRLIRKNGRV